ncbi:hypothetical protein [Mycobacteroides chelonae]|uniref:hypothetical protein n=1 Tax=Mycobacteroides chelonae TaxID=1774 RepID=UPI0018F03C41|nr:hypothetical protein [Mycobacteroides chelonae]
MGENSDYELAWPRDLFRDELSGLVNAHQQSGWAARVELLLEDAFSSDLPSQQFSGLAGPGFRVTLNDVDQQRKFLASLLQRLEDLPGPSEQRPYWSERRSGMPNQEVLTLESVVRRYIQIVDSLGNKGYLEQAFNKDCVDEPSTVDPSTLIQDRIGRAEMWPLNEERLNSSSDIFFDTVEVIHDLVARPRNRSFHNYGDCGWHHSEFSRDTGRRLYRWQINRLLAQSEIKFLLAEIGEDEGRLVEVTDEARADLVQKIVGGANRTGSQIGHAIALFRQRDATEHDKRSAVATLALILEERRSGLKDTLYSGDEGALFEIANKFNVRHQNEGQKADYDPIFLDWTFWWYLATIELTDRVIARDVN